MCIPRLKTQGYRSNSSVTPGYCEGVGLLREPFVVQLRGDFVLRFFK
jgi:hypothetical protein